MISEKFINTCDSTGWYPVQLGKNINKVLPLNIMFELDSIIRALNNITLSNELTGGTVNNDGCILEDKTFIIKDINLILLEATNSNDGLPIYGIFAKVYPLLDTVYGINLKNRLDNQLYKVSFRLNGMCEKIFNDGLEIRKVHKITNWNYINYQCSL